MLYVVGGSSVSFPGMVAVSSALLLSSFLSAVKEPHAVNGAYWPWPVSHKRKPKT